MKVTCRSCSTVREIAPPPWVVASGKPFQMTCASCGTPQIVHPTGIVVLDEAEATREPEVVLEMPAPTAERATSPDAAPARRAPRRPGGAVPFDSGNREEPADPRQADADLDDDPEDEPTEPSLVATAAEVRAAALAWDEEQGTVPVLPPVPEGLEAGAYAVLIDGDVYEAPDRAELYRWIDDQRVHADDMVARGGGGWVRARDLSEVQARLDALAAAEPIRMPVVVGAPPGGEDLPRPVPRAKGPTGTLTEEGPVGPALPTALRRAAPLDGLGDITGDDGPAGPATHQDEALHPVEPWRRPPPAEERSSGRLVMGVLALALVATLVALWQVLVGFPLAEVPGATVVRPATEVPVLRLPVEVVDAAGPPPPAAAVATPEPVAPSEPVAAPEPVAPPEPTAPAPEPPPVAVVTPPKPAPRPPREEVVPARPAPAPVAAVRPAPAPAPRVEPVVPPPPRAPLTYASLVSTGWAAVERNDLVQALGAFKEALDRDPQGAEASYGFGYALVKRGRLTEGRLHLCRARVGVSAMDRREIDGVLAFHGLSCE